MKINYIVDPEHRVVVAYITDAEEKAITKMVNVAPMVQEADKCMLPSKIRAIARYHGDP